MATPVLIQQERSISTLVSCIAWNCLNWRWVLARYWRTQVLVLAGYRVSHFEAKSGTSPG
jgi:hypothetical protein